MENKHGRGFEIRDGIIYTAANQSEQMPSPDRLSQQIAWVVQAHTRYASPDKRFRKFDHRTPIIVHPLDVMAQIMQEPRLSLGDRAAGGLALLAHDVIEDTSKKELPDLFSPRVKTLVAGMTFFGGTEEEMEKVWDAEPFILLCKLYDKCGSWKTMTGMKQKKIDAHAYHLGRLREAVVENYGDQLHVVKFARAALALP